MELWSGVGSPGMSMLLYLIANLLRAHGRCWDTMHQDMRRFPIARRGIITDSDHAIGTVEGWRHDSTGRATDYPFVHVDFGAGKNGCNADNHHHDFDCLNPASSRFVRGYLCCRNGIECNANGFLIGTTGNNGSLGRANLDD